MIEAPAEPAGPESAAVPVTVVFEPPTKLAGDTDTLDSASGLIVKFAVCLAVPRVAVIVADVAAVTELVVTVKVFELDPAATVILVGTPALVLLEEMLTRTPPAGAGPLSLTVPCDEIPPTTVVGESATLVKLGGVMAKDVVLETAPNFAVITTDVDETTVLVDIVNVAVEAPAATVTDPGTIAAVELEDKLTVVPPDGAGELRVTVPVEVEPPTTVVGFRLTALRG